MRLPCGVVRRGGKWSSGRYFGYLRAADRDGHYPTYQDNYIGFRCVADPGG